MAQFKGYKDEQTILRLHTRKQAVIYIVGEAAMIS